MKIHKRRIYDITNCLEGSRIRKTKKNNIELIDFSDETRSFTEQYIHEY